jgi:serine/threonine-protein kinase SRPK3
MLTYKSAVLTNGIDLKPDNIMVKIEDPSILERDARDEYDHPLPQKHADGRTIYLSRNNYGQLSVPTGIVQIVDFDLSVLGDMPRSGCIQAEIYRAPEVILDAGYTYSADIWSLGVMVRSHLSVSQCFISLLMLRP